MDPASGDEALAEQLWVLRAQLGSHEAYSRLATRYDARLLFYLRRLLGTAANAEDLRQEVWLTVIRKLHTLEEPAAFRSWLYRVARHHAISFLRKRRLEVPLEEIAPRDEPSVAADPDDEDFPAAEAGVVHAALAGLSPSHREVLTLRFLGDLTYDEIARVIGCRVGTVRSRIHYAKAALREAIPAALASRSSDDQPEKGG